MTTIALPADLLVRPATREDAPAISAMNAGYELAAFGTTESTANDVYELWDSEHTNLATDTCAITTRSGELVGYTGVAATNRGIMLDVHTNVQPAYQHQPIIPYLLQFAEERARALLSAQPDLPRKLYTWSFTPHMTALLQSHGYLVESSDYRMQIDFAGAPPAPQQLEGITIRPFVPGQEERAVYDVIAEAFPDIDGKPYRPFDEWYENVFVKRQGFEPSMLYVAVANQQIVGTTLCRLYPEDNSGYIWQLAVRRTWRKHGIALQLLRTAFAEFYRRGIKRVLLDVASQSQTGAQQLYARAGMHKRSQVDSMQKTL